MATQRILLVILLLMLASTACILTDLRDAVETVNKAVDLLTEISESGTWTYIGDGVNAITSSEGYKGTITIAEGTTNDTGETITATTSSVRWEISTDADSESRIVTVQNDQTFTFVTVKSDRSDSNGNPIYDIYRENATGQYECWTNQDGENELFAASLSEAFAQYSAVAIGVQAISIAEEDGTESLNGFETTRYKLVSKLQEALDILAEFPSDELQQDIADVPPFYIDGALYIDQESQALVRFEALYADLEKKQGNQFLFELNELGNQPDIQVTPSQIVTPCAANPTATP